MRRGYRFFVLAAVGLALCGGSKGQLTPRSVSNAQIAAQGKKSDETGKPSPQAFTAPEAPETQLSDAGCTDKKDRRDSSLCAQWKAADAAVSATNWAKVSSLLAIFSTFVAVVGTIGLYLQIGLTRTAIEGTVDANKVMQESNRQAIVQFRHGQKPHIYIEAFGYVADVQPFLRLKPHDDPIQFLYKVGIRIYNKGSFAFLQDFELYGYGPDGRIERGELSRFIEPGGTTYLGHRSIVDAYLDLPQAMLRPGMPDDAIQIPYAIGYATSNFTTDIHPPALYGFITYSDSLGIVRKRGFGIRPVNLRSGKFEDWGGEEYNYEKTVRE